MQTVRELRFLAAVSVIALAISACSTGTASPSAAAASPSAAGGGGTTVPVALQEWSVLPASASAPAGSVTFQVTNTGPEDVHEFVVLKTDLDPGVLPVDETGAVTEAGEGIEVIGEIEDVAVGATPELTVTLAAGKYVLLCNIYDETEKEAHYKMGMRTPFAATE
jgi:iron uptake system component EfeO